MKDTRIGNDIKVGWSIFREDGSAFSLEGLNVSLYLKSMFGRKELNDFVTTGNIIQWTFYGKDQKSTGKYSLELVINEGEKGMITTDTCDFVNLVSCSCKLQGGEDAPNVETESIELTSTLEYVAGGSGDITIDTELSETSQNAIANATVTAELTKVSEELKKKLSVDVVIAPTNDAQVLMSAFKTYDLANKLNVPMQCLIKKERSDKDYMLATLIVEDYRSVNAGYRLTFSMYGNKANAMSGGKIDEQSVYSPDAQNVDNILSYLYNEQYGYVIPLGAGNLVFPELENKVKEMLKGKVDAEEGKGLSTNDFTDELKEKVSNFKIDEALDPYSNNAIMNAVVTRKIESVENSISKLPKTPNWLANQGQDGYIQNRTHWWHYIGLNYEITAEQTDANRCPVNGLYDVYYDSTAFENVIIDGTPKRYTSTSGYYELVIIENGTFGILNYIGILFSGDTYWRAKEVQPLSEIYIPDTIARKSKLTELSAEVGGLSEEMANKQDVYVAEYGVTTREQIKAAWEANKHIVCVYGNKLYNLTNYGDVYDIYFACVYYSVELLMLSVAGNWTRKTLDFERQDYKVKTISASSTDTQYPSAKAVYDFVNTTLGTIINGDY